MSDHTVTVSYDSQQDSWTFTPYRVMAYDAGKVILTRAANQSWTFNGSFNVTGKNGTNNPPSGEFQKNAGSSSTIFKLDNSHSTNGLYCYTVSITLPNGQTVTSPDPEIQNTDPPKKK